MADPTFTVARGLAQRVEIRIVTVTENAALFQRERWIIQQRVGQFLSERRHLANGVLQMFWQGGIAEPASLGDVRRARRSRPTKLTPLNQFAKLTLERRDLLQRHFQSDKITRVPRGLAQSSGGALDIPDGL